MLHEAAGFLCGAAELDGIGSVCPLHDDALEEVATQRAVSLLEGVVESLDAFSVVANISRSSGLRATVLTPVSMWMRSSWVSWSEVHLMIASSSWLHADSTRRKAVRGDSRLYEVLALIDALREGRTRERQIAEDELLKRIHRT